MKLLQFNLDIEPKGYPTNPVWLTSCYKDFVAIITAKTPLFPCYFAPSAHFHSAMFYTYIEKEELDNPVEFLNSVSEYLLKVKESKHYTALVVFIETSLKNQSLLYYENCFWNLLQYMIDNDSKKWSDATTKDCDDQAWKFYFDGVPIFINGHSSAYKKRKTRSAPCDLMLIIQPFENLDRLESHSNAESVSNHIRRFVNEYDGANISHVFGKSFIDPNTYNWKQFWLAETDAEITDSICPLKIK